ncbi:MAG TPA: AAA family ATPase, partial [Polyangia bacterium]|nr:AAA family ATPase [Polyangia bacterium]
LGGRCYERESFPYKALDSAMDALARYLTRLPEAQVEGLLPPYLRTLTRLFPVLERIPAIERAAAAEAEVIDPQEQRRRAVTALRQLLVRLAERSPVVLALDDLQWGDLDSADLLGELLRVPQAPAVLLIASYRSDEVETSPFLRSLLASRALADVEVRHLPIAALSSEAARRLAEELVHGRAKGQDLQNLSVEAITREAGGSPYLIDALINYAEAAATVAPVHEEPPPAAMTAAAGATEPTTTPGDISPRLAISRLDRLLLARIEQLPAAARHLLEVVSVAGRPIEATLAAGAAGLQQVELEGLATLRAARLLRMRLTEDGEELEAYHDRIRETVVAALSPDLLRDRHRRLAHTLEASPRPALDALAAHFRGAGEPERAFSYAVAAADQAAHALAFERAAHLYEMALGLRTLERPGERELQIKCADALRHANRGAEAAQMYLAAARGLTGREAFALEQRAAEQFLLSGHLDAGREVLDAVLGRIGLGIAPTPLRALARFLLLRMRLWLRGLEFRKTDEAALSPEALVAVDTCRMVSLGLSMVDSIRAAEFQARGLLLALELGEPYRVSLTLSAEIPFSALDGGAQRERTAALSRQAEALALEVGEPHAIGLMRSSQAGAAWLEGRWRQALELAEESEDILRRRCTGVSWELGTSTFVILDALFYLGEWSRLRERLKVSLDDACARGDLRSEVQLRIAYASALALAADDPRTARAELEAIERWTRTSFHFLHTLALLGQCREAIYSGRGEEAWQTISRQWSVLQSHMQFRVQYVFILMLDLRARCALAAARAPTGTNPRQVRRLLAAADKDADTLEHLGVPWSEALAALVRAGVAAARGEEWPTLTALERAEAACLRADMSLHAWVARHCRGRVLGAAKGRRLREEAEAALRAQGAQAPERLSAWFVPAPWPDA